MNKHVIIFAILLILGGAGMLGYYFIKPLLLHRTQTQLTDARDVKGVLRVGVDSWIGYYPLCSKEMQKQVRTFGYRLKCLDDKANYDSRMKAMTEGSLDFAVATVDSYIVSGSQHGFPGVIVMVIDESAGGDAIVAHEARFKSINDLKTVDPFQVAFTPASPSEHLLRSVAAHFEVDRLKDKTGTWRLETNGSEEALKLLLDGKTDVAVLWEPDVSRALASNKGIVKLLGTENTQKLIVDVLLVNQTFLASNSDVVRQFLAAYFKTLKHYRDDPDRLASDVKDDLDMKADQVEAMLNGVKFKNLYDNALAWYGLKDASGIGYEGLADAIDATVQILMDLGDFKDNPLPRGDPYRLQNRTFIEFLYQNGIPGVTGFAQNTSSGDAIENSLEAKFSALSADEWNKLREVGMLKVRPITFQSGTEELDLNGKTEIDKAALNLKHYPHFRVLIKGHTAQKGDEEANKILSQNRAEAVKRYLTITYNIDPNRLQALGKGSSEPLPRLTGESDRAYSYRLPRVELHLVSEVY